MSGKNLQENFIIYNKQAYTGTGIYTDINKQRTRTS